MNEEDEAFEDLAKRQGDWGMQGSRKHQIMRYAENVENKGTSMTDKEAMKLALDALELVKWTNNLQVDEAIAALKERLAQPEQEPLAWMDADGNVSDNNDHKCFPIPLYTNPPQRTEQGDKHES